MNWQNALSFGPLTAATAVAVLTAAIIPRFPVGSPPLFDDLICWILVLAIVGYPSAANSRIWEINGVSSETPLKRLYWIAASSMVLNATFSSLFDTIWIYPVVAYALLAYHPSPLLTRLHTLLPQYLHGPWFVFTIGIAIFVSLLPTFDNQRLILAIPTALGLAGTYWSLICISGQDDEFIDGWQEVGTQEVVRSLAPRAHYLIALTSVSITTIWPPLTFDWANAFWAGGLKAIHWISILWLTQKIPWKIAPTIWAYVAASTGSSHPTAPGPFSMLQTFARAVIAVLSLYQVVNFLPVAEGRRALLGVFAWWPASSLVQQTLFGGYTILFPGSKGPQ